MSLIFDKFSQVKEDGQNFSLSKEVDICRNRKLTAPMTRETSEQQIILPT